jgi:quinoprotein glucose dehydrogenase
MYRIFVLVTLTLGTALAFAGAQPDPVKPYSPSIAPASNEPAASIKSIRLPKGFQISVFAAEPMLANPVCFCIDQRNRFYVAETFRIHHGVEDTREHMHWLDDDMACRTVADRVAMYRKHLKDKVKGYAIEHERIRLIEDVDGDGKADRATVFADGFNQVADGIGAGLLARGSDVWYACIPNLWLLRDTKGAGKADVRRSLHYGYGVHVNFYGHDLHGLRFGPDGKLYFSIGDRGLHVETEGRTLAYPDTGTVLRCNPDGSDLEVIASGLRNPQELAFDQYGNLFTGDNNADGGDKARWVYVVEGGDSGWRIGYQYLQEPVALGPWNAEKLWQPQWDGQAAYLVPPIANVADGPAGLAYYPGLGLPERYQGHFFLCDFRGSSGQSGIRSFAVKPKGASFDFVDQHEFIWSVLATDVDFGTDGALYILDWVDGWSGTKKGRVYRVTDPERIKDPLIQGVKKLLAEGMGQRPMAELASLLEHPDMRVRQEAQFALAGKGTEAIATLAEVARGGKNQLARLHAVWGLGQIGRITARALKPVEELLTDSDAEVRAQAAKVVGDARLADAAPTLLALLKDPEARVRFFAALGLGKLRRSEAVGPVLQLLRDNADKDAYLRHAGVMALTWINDQKALLAAAQDHSPAVRMAVLLTLRRLQSPDVAGFLNDVEPRLVLEAARAIYDVPIPAALPQVAALLSRPGLSESLLYRVLNANFRLGQPANATAVASYAARTDAPEALRIEAVHELTNWTRPSGRDRIVGVWRPLEPRPAHVAADAVRPLLGGIFKGPAKVREEAVKMVATLGVKRAGPFLVQTASDQGEPSSLRVEALKALETLKDARLLEVTELAVKDTDGKFRTEGCRVLARVQPARALRVLKEMLERGGVAEQQGAFTVLADMNQPEVDTLLSQWLDRLRAGQVRLEIQLDLLQAAGKRKATDIKHRLKRYEEARSKGGPLVKYQESLAGGNADKGKEVFLHKYEVQCQRCHKVKGEGGEVGPDLTGIGSRQKREYLLESIVDPNKEIAKGFETVVVTTTSGLVHTGIVKAEDAKELRLITAEGKIVTVAKSEIEERTRGKSAMPEDVIKHLSRAELRDLVEFLAGLK